MVVCVLYFCRTSTYWKTKILFETGAGVYFLFLFVCCCFSSHFDVSHALNFKRLRYQKYIRCREGPVGETSVVVTSPKLTLMATLIVSCRSYMIRLGRNRVFSNTPLLSTVFGQPAVNSSRLSD